MKYNERSIVFLLSAVQFINILDFMMVMPLGPDFARALDVSAAHLGYVGGSYTAAAAVSGVLCSFFLDRFDRRPALAFTMLGLGVGTAMGGFAWSFETLLFSRVVAGAFGGPATALTFAIVADVIPPERRGRATGSVMGAFAFASVVGVPAGLELARVGGWTLPFFVVAAFGVVITLLSFRWLPAMSAHIQAKRAPAIETLRSLVRAEVLTSYLMTALAMGAGFIIIPNISAYVQNNLHYPRERLGLLYLCGGAISFFTTRYGGRVVDRFGSTGTALVGTVLLSVTVYIGFVEVPPLLSPPVLFMGFMLAMGLRNVAYNTLTSKVPRQHERAQFLSMQSAVQHIASASGAFVSARLLTELPDHSLVGMKTVALTCITLTLLLPFVVWTVERTVRARLLLPAAALLLLIGCDRSLVVSGAAKTTLTAGPLAPLSVDGARILDARGRQVILRGLQQHALQDVNYQGRQVLDSDYALIASWGFRTLRLAISWSKIEPAPGMYDDSYINEIERACDLAFAAGLTVVVEWHQDQYGRCSIDATFNNGNGAPDWACDATIPRGLLAYIQQFDGFWRNERGVYESYVAAFSRVIARVGEHPAVIGYDLINEPYGGSPDFATATLLPAYRALVPRLRAAGARGLMFLDAPGFRNESHVMATIPMGDIPDLVYAPHLYTSWLSLFLFGVSPDAMAKTEDFKLAAEQAQGLELPWWNGEWGVNYFLDDWRTLGITHVRLEDKHMVGGSYWAFEQATPNQGDQSVSGGQSLLDGDRNVRTDLLDVLSRPYPIQTPGVLRKIDFDFKTHALTVELDATSKEVMTIYAPRRHLGASICVDVKGAGTHGYDYDATNEIVLLRFDATGAQSVTLKPCP